MSATKTIRLFVVPGLETSLQEYDNNPGGASTAPGIQRMLYAEFNLPDKLDFEHCLVHTAETDSFQKITDFSSLITGRNFRSGGGTGYRDAYEAYKHLSHMLRLYLQPNDPQEYLPPYTIIVSPERVGNITKLLLDYSPIYLELHRLSKEKL